MRHEIRWFRVWVSGLVVTLVLACSSVVSAFDVPSHRGAVTDTAGVLTAEDEEYLEHRIARYEARSGNELGVLVVPSLDGESIEDVAYQTFNRWGVGKKGSDNGVLLVIAVAEHRTRIETGKGIGHKLTDLAAGRILSERLAPRLRTGAFRDGIDVTLSAIEGELESVQPTTTTKSPAPSRNPKTAEIRDRGPYVGIAFILVGLGAVFGLVPFLTRSTGRRRRRLDASEDGELSSFSRTSLHHDVPTVTTSFASVDTSSGFSGGGDFGGGSSGGGGASGSW